MSGSVVNLAARTMTQAGAGETLVTGSVGDQLVGSRFTFVNLGEHRLKGFDSPRVLLRVEPH